MTTTMTTVSKEQAYQLCSEAVKNRLASRVLVDKYLMCKTINDKHAEYAETTPQQMWRRLATANAAAEKPEDRERFASSFYEILDDWYFVPGGRIMYGLGNIYVNVTLKNCYIFQIQEDSMKGVFDTGYWMAETYKGGGGCGLDISPLRPKNSPVNNAARVSGGAVGFMDFFSHITGMIGQKGRIGALLLGIDISHPDVEDFIQIKGGDDLNLVRYANISVKATDNYMQALIDGRDFDLAWGGKIYKTVKARDLWSLIQNRAWKRAEPGVLFFDAVLRGCPSSQYPLLRPVCTNPCLTGNMRLYTESGYKTMRELWAQGGFQEYDGEPSIKKHGELKIVNSKGVVSATNVYRTNECTDVFRVILKDGTEIDATENHKFITVDNNGQETKKELRELKVGDKLPLNQQQIFGDYHYPEYAELAGWVIGDGSISDDSRRPGSMRAHIPCYGKDIEDVLPQLREDLKAVYRRSNKSNVDSPEFEGREETPEGFNFKKKTIRSSVLGRLLKEDGLEPGNKHHIPKSLWQGNKETIAAFIRGFFSADGSVQINSIRKCISVRNMQVNRSILDECKLLLNQFGITCSVSFRRAACQKLMNDGKGGKKLYNKKAEYELIVSGRCNVEKFINEIGFIQVWKPQLGKIWLENHLGSNNSIPRTSSVIKEIISIGTQETFCITEPETHEIVIEGTKICNCGEIPAGHGDSCNLGSLNMGKYVRKSWTKEAYFDEQLFEKHARLATRFLDNIITLEKTPLEFQQAANDQGRRLGLGVMGLADVFLRMGIKYDSDQAIELSDKLMALLRNSAYDESCNLAVEKGPFPAFEVERHLKSEFIQRLPEPIINKIKKNGIRNVANLSIAPTGSLAVVAECSSGVEPIFKITDYIRKTNLGTAKEVQEHVVSHDAVREYCEVTGCKPDHLPDYFVGAYEVDNYKRLALQGTIQKYIDQAISNTFNLPKETTPEEIGNLYIQAWRLGLKGITVYRDSSREGVLVDVKEKSDTKDKIVIHSAPARPDSLDAKVHVIKPNGTTYTVFVGLMDERVFEVFALDQKLAGVADGMTGKIVRERTPSGNFYHFECGAMTVTKLNSNEDNEASLITRLVSTSLRHGVPLEFIIDQISKSRALINSFAKAIVKALSIYVIKEEMKGKFRCKNCGSDNIKIEGTCRTCHNCGESKCG